MRTARAGDAKEQREALEAALDAPPRPEAVAKLRKLFAEPDLPPPRGRLQPEFDAIKEALDKSKEDAVLMRARPRSRGTRDHRS